MKIKSLHSSFSFLLAVLILLSTSSFAIEKHFCSGFLVDSAIFTQVEKCANEPCAITAKDTAISKPDCCDDELHLVEGQEAVTHKKVDDSDDEQQEFLLAFTETYFYLHESLLVQIIPHRYYIPPILVTDFKVLHQDFLI